MKKLETVIGTTKKDVEVHSDHLVIEGEKVQILSRLGDLMHVKMNGHEYKVEDVFVLDGNTIRVELSGYTIDVKVIDPISSALAVEGSGSGEIKAPLAGQISKIEVTEGKVVKKGDLLMVISAMKMENKIKSPIDGTISKIMVNLDDAVQSDQLLIVITPDTE